MFINGLMKERNSRFMFLYLSCFLNKHSYTTLFILILSGSKDKRSKKNVHKDSKTNPNTGIVNPECSSTSISKDSGRSFSNITIIPS